MTDPFRSELEAARARIEKLESEHAAEVAKLRAENERLRKRLIDIAPSQSKAGRTFFAFAMIALALSLAFGMFFARVLARPEPARAALPAASVVELPPDFPVLPANVKISDEAVASALSAIRLDGCGDGVRGHASITFAPTGFVTLVRVDPPLAGTSVGSCVEGRYRAARVPPFTSAPQTFGKSFVIAKDDSKSP